MSLRNPAFKPEVLSLVIIPEHELVSSIASGAYGQVWLARNKLGVLRAVKIVRRGSFDHDRPFEREFTGIKAFEPISRSHEGFVDLLQVGRDDQAGYFYYVMELADDARESVISNQSGGIGGPSIEGGAGPPITGPMITDSLITDYSPKTLGTESA